MQMVSDGLRPKSTQWPISNSRPNSPSYSGLHPRSVLRSLSTLRPSDYVAPTTTVPDNGLYDGQYEIGGLVFGTRDIRGVPNSFIISAFDVTPGTLIGGQGGNLSQSSASMGGGTNTADSSLPNEDGIRFGQDYHTGMIITMSIDVWTKNQMAYDTVGKLKSIWNSRQYRYTTGVLATLRMCRGGRTRLVYGRPRQFKETYGSIERGWAPIDAQFQCVDEIFYDDIVNSHDIGLANPPVSGLTLPSTTPFTISQYQEEYTTIHVDGDWPAWPIYIIYGPVVNPSIRFDYDWTLTLLTTLDHTQYAIIDPRPWQRTTVRGDGANLSGKYTSDSPLMRNMSMEPGQHSIVYSGSDPSLTSRLNVTWRNAYTTP